MAASDVIYSDDLSCALCGMNVEVSCPVHGPQETVTIQEAEVRCVAWDEDRGDECWERCEVDCVSCGITSAVEADDNDYRELDFYKL